MMTLKNFIETEYRELTNYINTDYKDLYSSFSDDRLKEVFSTLHSMLVNNFKSMNSRLPTTDHSAHFWAESSRELLLAFNVIRELEKCLESTEFAFKIDSYYSEIIDNCSVFLKQYSGSEIPIGMEKISIYYVEPIFLKKDSVVVDSHFYSQRYLDLNQIGEGSYAFVYTFEDKFYNRKFVLKRAKSNLNEKEKERFLQEYKQMSKLSSPYIVEVYHFDTDKYEYVMERLDYTLLNYYEKFNSTLTTEERKNIARQVLRAFKYIHSKGLLHRDISPNNILLKVYDDGVIAKIADFGLVKVPNSQLTSLSTDFKGWFNDLSLQTEGFDHYGIQHETYAITRLVYFIMTGKTNTSHISNPELKTFVEKGMSNDKSTRYKNVDEMIIAFGKIHF